MTKKQIRAAFRKVVFERDNYKCKCCKENGYDGQDRRMDTKAGKLLMPLDAHHITNRNKFPNGGYVKENGVSLCPSCHKKAEIKLIPPSYLYKLIGSTLEKAIEADAKNG